LFGEGFAVDKDQGGGAAFGGYGAGDDGLAGAGWRDQDAVVVGEQRVDCGGLAGREFRGEGEVVAADEPRGVPG
jgi:hypothetical protein